MIRPARPRGGSVPAQLRPPAAHCLADEGARFGLRNALADVLLGTSSPGGRLAQTWPRSLADLPAMMDYARPRLQLRSFERVALAPSETRTVRFRLAAQDLAYWDASRDTWVVERGAVELLAGRSSADADLGLRLRIPVVP